MIQVYNSKAVGAEDRELGTRVHWPVPNDIGTINLQLGQSTTSGSPSARVYFIYTCAIMKISITSGKYDLEIPTSFGETSFAIRHKLLKINKWHQTPHIFQIVHLPSIYVHISNSKIKIERKPSKF